MSFQKINNQSNVVSALKSALEKERLPHALLFQGPMNSGQREMAAELAKAIFCENKKGLECCDTCYHCRQVDKNTHPDFFVLELKEDARDIKVEDVREMMTRAAFKPFTANAKVFVVDRAERMNDIAQNAFLKTLEEPEGRTVFVLISSAPEGLLATIRSRVQLLNFVPVAGTEKVDEENEPLLKAALEYALYHSAEPLKAPELSRLKREELSQIFNRLVEYYRDMLLLKVGAGEILGEKEDIFEKEKLSRALSEEEIEERIELFSNAKHQIGENLNAKLVLSVLWDTLASAANKK